MSPLEVASSATLHLAKTLPQNDYRIILINTSLKEDSEAGSYIKQTLSELFRCHPRRVLLVDIGRALQAIDTLRADPTSTSAITQFQSKFIESSINEVIQLLEETLSLGPTVLHANKDWAFATNLVEFDRRFLSSVREEGNIVRSNLIDLRSRIFEAGEKSMKEIFETHMEKERDVNRSVISSGIAKAAEDVKPTFDKLKWWKLPVVVDDVSSRVDYAVERAYVKEFEHWLVFHTGRLSSLQSAILSETNMILASLPPSFQSPVLQNKLAQLSSSPSFEVASIALLEPLRYRLRQLSLLTRTLHLSAQRVLLVSYFSTVLSTVSAYSAWMWNYVDSTTAVGGGVLGVLLVLRWAVGHWEKAKKEWWGDWRRVGDGLERDIKSAAKNILEKQVCIVPEEACKGLEQLLERQKLKLDEFDNEVDSIHRELIGTKDKK